MAGPWCRYPREGPSSRSVPKNRLNEDSRFFFFLHDGQYLHAAGGFGCRIFDVHESCKSDGPSPAKYAFKDGDYHGGAAINKAGTLLATSVHRRNLVIVRELPSGKEVARLDQGAGLPLGLTFDEASQHLFLRHMPVAEA